MTNKKVTGVKSAPTPPPAEPTKGPAGQTVDFVNTSAATTLEVEPGGTLRVPAYLLPACADWLSRRAHVFVPAGEVK